MAKPKHPTIKTLRPGQTIYIVMNDFQKGKYTVKTMLHSNKTPLPESGCSFEKLPVNHLVFRNMSMHNVYYSRKMANREVKRSLQKKRS